MAAAAVDPPADARSLAIVVVTFGAHELLNRNLATIKAGAVNAEIVIVDNFHSAAERAAIESIAQRQGWRFLPMPGNVGFGAAMNRGVEFALGLGCRTFLLLNPDARLAAGAVDALRADCDANPLTMISPQVVRTDGSAWFCGSYLDEKTGNVGRADDMEPQRDRWLSGACLMIHAELWQRLGGFDPDYFLYWEDIDLSRRCVDAGGRLSVRRDLVAVHDVGGTQQQSGKSAVYYYYNCRNRLLYAAKHLPRRSALRWLLYTPAASRWIVLRGGRRQLIESPGLLWAAVRGSLVGAMRLASALLRRRSVDRTHAVLAGSPVGARTASTGGRAQR